MITPANAHGDDDRRPSTIKHFGCIFVTSHSIDAGGNSQDWKSKMYSLSQVDFHSKKVAQQIRKTKLTRITLTFITYNKGLWSQVLAIPLLENGRCIRVMLSMTIVIRLPGPQGRQRSGLPRCPGWPCKNLCFNSYKERLVRLAQRHANSFPSIEKQD